MSANGFNPQALQSPWMQPVQNGWQQQPQWQQPAQQQPWGQAPANPWQQPAAQLPAYDPNAAARRVAELEAMVNQLSQQLNAVIARLGQQPGVQPLPSPQNPWAQQPAPQNPWGQAPVQPQPVQPLPSPQAPRWLNQLPSWLRPSGVQPAAVAPVAPVAPAAPAAPAVPMSADGRPQPLVDAIRQYRDVISAESRRTSSLEGMIFSGAMHPGGAVYLLPGLMLPHGVQMLSWAYLGRAATNEEVAKYQRWNTEAAGNNADRGNVGRIMKDIEDRGVFERIQKKIAAGQPVADLAQEAADIRKAAAALLFYPKD